MADQTVGIDLGGTKIYGVRLDGDDVGAEAKTKTPTLGGPLAVVDAIVEVVGELGFDGGRLGVGAPGMIVDGVVRTAPNLPGWIEPFPLAQALS
ncbi:MAG: ROK family protein, partial [Acidimicrobiales bacterium]